MCFTITFIVTAPEFLVCPEISSRVYYGAPYGRVGSRFITSERRVCSNLTLVQPRPNCLFSPKKSRAEESRGASFLGEGRECMWARHNKNCGNANRVSLKVRGGVYGLVLTGLEMNGVQRGRAGGPGGGGGSEAGTISGRTADRHNNVTTTKTK